MNGLYVLIHHLGTIINIMIYEINSDCILFYLADKIIVMFSKFILKLGLLCIKIRLGMVVD